MNMIGIIIYIVLSAIILSIGTFYGDSMYKEQKNKALALKIKNDMTQISFAIKKADSDGLSIDGESGFQSLIKYGILSEIPYFDKDEAKRSGYGSDYEMANSFDNDLMYSPNMVRVQIKDINVCKKINDEYSLNYAGTVPTIDETKQQDVPLVLIGALFNHLSVHFESLDLFESKIESVNKTFCYRVDDGRGGAFVISHIVDMSRAFSDYIETKNSVVPQ